MRRLWLGIAFFFAACHNSGSHPSLLDSSELLDASMSEDAPPCGVDACQHGGVCWLSRGGERCDCTNTGFSGPRCEDPLSCRDDAMACGDNSTCDNLNAQCACSPGFGDCDGEPGCEASLTTTASCGACGRVCGAGQECREGSCVCLEPRTLCSDACRDLANDAAHCGECDRPCGGEGICSEGRCQCPGADGSACAWGCDSSGGCDVPVAISGRGAHTCLLTKTGAAYCWGDNTEGQLGDGTTIRREFPVRVLGLPAVTQISTGGGFTCALLKAGKVTCWGSSNAWQSDAKSAEKVLSPTEVRGLDQVVQIAGTCALLADGSVRCWERAGNPRAALVPKLEAVRRLASSVSHSCAIVGTGRVACWGNDWAGEFGGPASVGKVVVVPREVAGVEDAVDVAVGPGHTCIVRATGKVACWGLAGLNGGFVDTAAPVEIPSLDNIVSIAAASQTCALDQQGRVLCWGSNEFGESGMLPDAEVTTPVAVEGLGYVVQISAGYRQSCAIDEHGLTACWGDRDYTAAKERKVVPRPKRLEGLTAQSLYGGARLTCARDEEQVNMCWGTTLRLEGDVDQLEIVLPKYPIPIPFQLDLVPNPQVFGVGFLVECAASAVEAACSGVLSSLNTLPLPAQQLSAGGTLVWIAFAMHVCGVDQGTVWCFGMNNAGQLGKSDDGSGVVEDVLTGVDRVAAGGYHTCALMTDGTVQCWGGNDFNQLGFASETEFQNAPGRVPGLTDVSALDATVHHTCAIANGEVWCWGGAAKRAVTRVAGITERAVDVQVGEGHACALDERGSVWCWGENESGQLGNGTTNRSDKASLVANLSGIVDLVVGASTGCARNAAGEVWCWGNREFGGIGDGVTITQRVAESVVAPWEMAAP